MKQSNSIFSERSGSINAGNLIVQPAGYRHRKDYRILKSGLIISLVLLLVSFPFFTAGAASDDSEDEQENKWFNLFNSDSSTGDEFGNNRRDKTYNKDRTGRRSRRKYVFTTIDSRRHFKPVDAPVYARECGACHFAYQPGLLPAGSWAKIMAGLANHFGEKITLEPSVQQDISQYLAGNSAEHSASKRAQRILRSLEGETPLRITETPYIKRKHEDMPKSILKRNSIRSLSNCQACHMTAKRGIYSDRYVHIPNPQIPYEK